MVFVIQHTQSREEWITQRKLDEILHALPRADDAVIALEEAWNDEVSATHQSHRQRRQNAVRPEASSGPEQSIGWTLTSDTATDSSICAVGCRPSTREEDRRTIAPPAAKGR